MNDDMMFEYLIQMGAMQPEQIEMMRKQKQIDALRERSMDMPQGRMIGKHYVAPSITQYAANALQGYMAGKQQQGQDAAMVKMNDKRDAELRKMQEEIRKRRMGGGYGDTATLIMPGGGTSLGDTPGY